MAIWQVVEGYFTDDNSSINGVLIAEYDNTPEGYSDDDIFYYGASELDMYDGNFDEFVVTKYKRVA